jgi:hypothetical protein
MATCSLSDVGVRGGAPAHIAGAMGISPKCLKTGIDGYTAAGEESILVSAFAAHAHQQCPVRRPTLAVEWNRGPSYAVMPREELSTHWRWVIEWNDVHVGAVTFRVLDQAAFYSGVEVCGALTALPSTCAPDGPARRRSTRDDHRPPQ